MKNKLEYIGKIDSNAYDECGITIGDRNFMQIADDIECYLGREKIIHVSYFISDIKLTKSKFLENHLMKVSGEYDVECHDVYGSEFTGYMWTEQKFNVGGHDLISELASYDEKYCYLKIYNAVEYRNESIDDILKK